MDALESDFVEYNHYWYLDAQGEAQRGTAEQWLAMYRENRDEGTPRRILAQAHTSIAGQTVMVSTVFVGLGPLPFESALFIEGEDTIIRTSATRAEALEHFQMAVDRINEVFGIKLEYEINGV